MTRSSVSSLRTPKGSTTVRGISLTISTFTVSISRFGAKISASCAISPPRAHSSSTAGGGADETSWRNDRVLLPPPRTRRISSLLQHRSRTEPCSGVPVRCVAALAVVSVWSAPTTVYAWRSVELASCRRQNASSRRRVGGMATVSDPMPWYVTASYAFFAFKVLRLSARGCVIIPWRVDSTRPDRPEVLVFQEMPAQDPLNWPDESHQERLCVPSDLTSTGCR